MGSDEPKTHGDGKNHATLNRGEFAALYRNVYPRMALVACGIVGDRTYADDIVQEAAIIALNKLDSFRAGTSFGAWMAAIVRRCALNYARKTKNRATFASDPVTMDHSRSGKTLTDQSIITDTGRLVSDQREFDDDVLEALKQLSEEARCCVLLRTVLDLSYVEISELLGMPKGTAMSHVHRGKAMMRKTLEGYLEKM